MVLVWFSFTLQKGVDTSAWKALSMGEFKILIKNGSI